MPNWKLTLEYDGTRYSGWQEQLNARTVAGELRKAAATFLGPDVQVDGAGRTDAGVHALSQVARITSKRATGGAETLLRKLNSLLPKDINVIRVEEAESRFHPRHDTLCRFYLYQISIRRTAFAKPYVWWLREKLDVAAMQAAAGFVVGRHDFHRFCDKRSEERSTIVVAQRSEIRRWDDLILFRIGASHFLWRMVRRIVGALAQVGLGKMTADEFGMLIAAPKLPASLSAFDVAANTAPASGLFLEAVIYEGDSEPQELSPAIWLRNRNPGL